jgi:pimeloyl-ACP methyl ester carboxylesterase
MPPITTRLQRNWLGARLFLGNYTISGEREPRPQLVTTASGSQFELYEPKEKARKTVALLTGMGILGEEDPRLIRVARGLASTGLRVAVPILHGLKSLKADHSDLSTSRDCFNHLLSVYGGPLTIVAFSTGGSIALTLSAEAEFRNRIVLIALFSPIYDLRDTWNRVAELSHTPIKDLQNADNEIWLHMVTAYRNHQVLGYTDSEKEEIREHLYRYTIGLTAQEKIDFYKNVLAKRPPNGHKLFLEEDALDAISPLGKVSSSTARVVVIHDANDFLVPQEQMHALARELHQRPSPNYRLLITPALSHVMIERPQYLLDIFHMIDIIGELYA